MSVIVLPLPGNEAMAQSIARAGDFELGQIETRRFPDGETYLRHLSPLKGRSVVLVCTLDHPDAKLVPLLFAANAAREQGARRVGLVAPYLAYMRQDRQFHAGEAVSARLFAAQLSSAKSTVFPPNRFMRLRCWPDGSARQSRIRLSLVRTPKADNGLPRLRMNSAHLSR
jgi:phosphoribosylpyrophosphate synthetase